MTTLDQQISIIDSMPSNPDFKRGLDYFGSELKFMAAIADNKAGVAGKIADKSGQSKAEVQQNAGAQLNVVNGKFNGDMEAYTARLKELSQNPLYANMDFQNVVHQLASGQIPASKPQSPIVQKPADDQESKTVDDQSSAPVSVPKQIENDTVERTDVRTLQDSSGRFNILERMDADDIIASLRQRFDRNGDGQLGVGILEGIIQKVFGERSPLSSGNPQLLDAVLGQPRDSAEPAIITAHGPGGEHGLDGHGPDGMRYMKEMSGPQL